LNCGACGTVCTGGATCSGGQCGCAGTLEYCSGVCVSVKSDDKNCGSRGYVCPANTHCTNGSCH